MRCNCTHGIVNLAELMCQTERSLGISSLQPLARNGSRDIVRTKNCNYAPSAFQAGSLALSALVKMVLYALVKMVLSVLVKMVLS